VMPAIQEEQPIFAEATLAVQKRAWLYDALESSLKHAPVSFSATQPPEAAIAPSNVLQTSMAESWSSLKTLLGEEHKLGGRAFGDRGGKPLQEDVLRAQAMYSVLKQFHRSLCTRMPCQLQHTLLPQNIQTPG
jgi:hypothetical protein